MKYKPRFKINPRMPFCAPPGAIMVEADFSAQELRAAAAYSGDEILVASFTSPPTIVVDEVTYDNPACDLHTQTAIGCIKPDWFQAVPTHELIKRAKMVPSGYRKAVRQYAKILNFACIYLATAEPVAHLNNVSVPTAEQWIKGHKATYKRYYEWAEEEGLLAQARGYAITSTGRIRWADEANAKGAGESIVRNAVNAKIQGLGACMTKMADIECRREFRGTDVQCLLAIHDALLFQIPGTLIFNEEKSIWKDGVCVDMKFEVNAEAKEIGARIINIMETIETDMFKNLNSPVPGKADIGFGAFWGH